MTNGFRHTTEFRQAQFQKPKTLEEAIRAINSLGEELNRTHNKLQDSFTRLQGAVGGTGSTVVISGGGTNTTTSITTTATDLRANSIAVVAGVNVITFATPMTKDYIIIPIYITPSYMGFIDSTQITYTMSGFSVTVDVAGILIYAVIPKTL
jgi:hypothetical protein